MKQTNKKKPSALIPILVGIIALLVVAVGIMGFAAINQTRMKEKTAEIDRALEALETLIEDTAAEEHAEYTEALSVERYAAEIEAFLALESVTNADMKKMIRYISVSSDGEVKIRLRTKNEAVSM